MEPPLCSSKEIIAALERAGFTYSRTRGDHATYTRRIAGEPTRVVVVVLAKREVARGTLRSILRQAGLNVEEFCALL